jgi:hypothetical protein
LTLAGGFARLTDLGGSSGGPEVRLSVLWQRYLGGRPGERRAFVSLGPEYGVAILGHTPPRLDLAFDPPCDGGCQDTVVYARDYNALVARGLVRLGVEDGAFRGYAVAGAGLHALYSTATNDTVPAQPMLSARDHHALGAAYGLGVQYRAGRRNAVGIELLHNVVRTYGRDVADGYWAVSATYTRTW